MNYSTETKTALLLYYLSRSLIFN